MSEIFKLVEIERAVGKWKIVREGGSSISQPGSYDLRYKGS